MWIWHNLPLKGMFSQINALLGYLPVFTRSYPISLIFSMRQVSLFRCLGFQHAQNFLMATPVKGLKQYMTPSKYQIILRYRLMILLFSESALFPLRPTRMDIYGEYDVHRRKWV